MTSHEAIASYETAAGATAATAHLVELGYAEHEVGIEPHGYAVVRPAGLWATVGRHARTVAVLVSSLAVIVYVIGTVGFDGLTTAALLGLAGIMVGSVSGAVVGAIRFARRRGWEVGTPDRLQPKRFDVVVSRDAADANHALARWWDPEALPTTQRAA